jgi:hypothetical protein
MINRDEGTFLGPYFRNESWWPPVARRCGFESVVTTSNFTEWRGGPARYHVYLNKGGGLIAADVSIQTHSKQNGADNYAHKDNSNDLLYIPGVD